MRILVIGEVGDKPREYCNIFLRINKNYNVIFNTIFNNISAILWRSVLLVEETRVQRENYRPTESHSQN